MTAQSAKPLCRNRSFGGSCSGGPKRPWKAQLGQTTGVLGGELRSASYGLHEQLDASAYKTEADLLALRLGTRKAVSLGGRQPGVTAALLLTGFVLQFFPSAVPNLSVSQHLEQSQGNVDGQAAELGGLQASLDQAREQLASLQQDCSSQ